MGGLKLLNDDEHARSKSMTGAEPFLQLADRSAAHTAELAEWIEAFEQFSLAVCEFGRSSSSQSPDTSGLAKRPDDYSRWYVCCISAFDAHHSTDDFFGIVSVPLDMKTP